MEQAEFDKCKFFGEMKGKVSGEWYALISSDFEDRTITIDDGHGSVIHLLHIEELEQP